MVIFFSNCSFSASLYWSLPLPVTSGVLQGSVLSPLLFLIYINDLPDCLVPPVQAKIFADDTKLYVAHCSDSISPLSLSLSNFCIWSQSWQLNIAFQKCSVISFGHNSANNSYSLGGVLLNRVYDICDLGVHITSDFKSSLLCASIAAKAFQRCSLLLKGLYTLVISTLCRVYIYPMSDQFWNIILQCGIHGYYKTLEVLKGFSALSPELFLNG